MTITTQPPTIDPEPEQLRREITRTQHLAREAVDALDVTGAIAHCRSLRSVLWRAQKENVRIDLAEQNQEQDQGHDQPAAHEQDSLA